MRVLVTTVRSLAIVLGAFWLLTSIADILGLLPYSGETPPIPQRVTHSIPSVAAGALLLLPYRSLQGARVRVGILCGLGFVVAWVLYLSAMAVGDTLSGMKSWHAVPAAMFLLTVTVANLWAYLRITRGAVGGFAPPLMDSR